MMAVAAAEVNAWVQAAAVSPGWMAPDVSVGVPAAASVPSYVLLAGTALIVSGSGLMVAEPLAAARV